jgi:hypothetical protein
MNLVSTVRMRKYKKWKKFWCEEMFVRFNYLIQVAIFHATVGLEDGHFGGSICCKNKRFFLFFEMIRLTSAPNSPFQCLLRVFVLGVKWSLLEADYLPPVIAVL